MFEPVISKIYDALSEANVSYSAMSWNGFNVFGTKKDMEEITRLMFVESRVAALEERLKAYERG